MTPRLWNQCRRLRRLTTKGSWMSNGLERTNSSLAPLTTLSKYGISKRAKKSRA